MHRFAVTSGEINQTSYVRKQNKFHSIEIGRVGARARACTLCLLAACIYQQDAFAFGGGGRGGSGGSWRGNARSASGIIFPIPYKYTERIFERKYGIRDWTRARVLLGRCRSSASAEARNLSRCFLD